MANTLYKLGPQEAQSGEPSRAQCRQAWLSVLAQSYPNAQISVRGDGTAVVTSPGGTVREFSAPVCANGFISSTVIARQG